LIQLALDVSEVGSREEANEPLDWIKGWEFVEQHNDFPQLYLKNFGIISQI
jgi:hypothetical protein